jgi:hypothetical protein
MNEKGDLCLPAALSSMTMAHAPDTTPADRIPPHLLKAMIENGIDPRAPFVESADGWRYGDPNVDISTPEWAEEVVLRTIDAMRWVDEQIAAPESERDPAAAVVLDLSRSEWLD